MRHANRRPWHLLLLFVLLLPVIMSCVLGPAPSAEPAPHAIALSHVLHEERIRAFYHLNKDARSPVQIILPSTSKIADFAGFHTGFPSVLENSDTPVAAGRTTIIISKIELEGPDKVIAFRIPIEGLFGTARLQQDGGGNWTTTSLELAER